MEITLGPTYRWHATTILYHEALMRKMSNTFISRLISSDNAIIKVLLDNMVARERMWEYWYSILY